MTIQPSSMKRLLLILIAGLMPSFAVNAASFDCDKATTKVEKLICVDASLSKLDEELAEAYQIGLQDEKQTAFIRRTEKRWLKERNSCSASNCLKSLYLARIRRLTSLLVQGKVLSQPAVFEEENITNPGGHKKYPPYPDTWHWESQTTSIEPSPDLFMLSNGDVLAGKRLLFGGQSVVSGELLVANPYGDLLKDNGRNVLLLSDGTQISGTKASDSFGNITLSNGLKVVSVGSDFAHGHCDHGPVDYFFHVLDKEKGRYRPNKVIFILLDVARRRMWDQPKPLAESDVEIDPCTEEGPPGYTTRVEAVWGGQMVPLDDGTFLLSMRNGLIVRFDQHFNTESSLRNRRFFVFDTNDSNLFIDELNGKKYDVYKTGYQPVYDDLYQYLTNIGSKQP